MTGNQLCGIDQFGHGTYTTQGITTLCEGLKGNAPSMCTPMEWPTLKAAIFIITAFRTRIKRTIDFYWNLIQEGRIAKLKLERTGIGVGGSKGDNGSSVTSLKCAAFAFSTR